MKSNHWSRVLLVLCVPFYAFSQSEVDSAYLSVDYLYAYLLDEDSDTTLTSVRGPYHLVQNYQGDAFPLFQAFDQDTNLALQEVGTFEPRMFDPDGYIDGIYILNEEGRKLQQAEQFHFDKLIVRIPIDHAFPTSILHQLVYYQIGFTDISEMAFYQD
ncbi:MAG: hypothetical protein AAF598_11605, partial [Bacteroidota bacterium]